MSGGRGQGKELETGHRLAKAMVNARVLCRRICFEEMVMRDERTAKERGMTR